MFIREMKLIYSDDNKRVYKTIFQKKEFGEIEIDKNTKEPKVIKPIGFRDSWFLGRAIQLLEFSDNDERAKYNISIS